MSFNNFECGDCGHLALQHAKGGGPCGLCQNCSELVCPFSFREFQVLKLMCAGGTKHAATVLNLSCKTIEAHRYNMLAKAHAHTTLELILTLLRSGALQLSDFPDSAVRISVRGRDGMIATGPVATNKRGLSEMSFLSVLKKIGHGVEVGTAAVKPFAPYLAAVPGFGPVFDLAFHGIQLAEQMVPAGPDSGPTKKSLVLGMVNAAHPGLDQQALGASIDQLVAALNKLGAAGAHPIFTGDPAAAAAK